MSEHYFSANPEIAAKRRTVSFEVHGENFELLAASGTFSATRLDPGTRVLLKQLKSCAGNILDIGCGWGPIAIAIAKLYPQATVWALDVNQRSLELVAENAKNLGLENVHPRIASEIDSKLEFDGIWSNPPIRVGKEILHGLMKEWLPRLKQGGQATLVVQKQLGAESFTKWLRNEFPNFEISQIANDKGYRVIRALKLN